MLAVFPLVWIILSSFKTSGEMASHPLAFFPETFTFEYYRRVLNNLHFATNIKNSLIVSLSATLITIVVSSLGAYGIVRFFPKAGKRMTKLLITTYMFPPILLAVPYSIIIIKLGLVNTWTGLVITYLSFSIPYAIWMLSGFFQTVPLEIEEAARVDGAGKWRVFVQVVLPIVAPGVVATAIYTFINTWNEFLFALLLINSSGKMPISVALYSLTGSEILDWGEMMAASVIVILPSIVFFMLIQRKIAGGMAEGSVK
ncbi:carbohydrate ABC transporter permease [Paenibacillus sp. J31TS4]|uniref:carbohydrate ABC transporter permease n=1 Tax=Paenibacillus sp. J31TS4 TaxID=2807195 RepID=UPI0035B5296E